MRKSANRFDLLKEKKTKQIKEEEEEEEEEDKFFDNKEIQRMRELAKKLSANLMKIKSSEGALNGESVKDNSVGVKTSNCAELAVKQSKDSEKNGVPWKEESRDTSPGPSQSGPSCDKGDNKYSSHHHTKSSSSKHESSPRNSHHKSHSKHHKKHHKKHKKRRKDAGILSHG